MLIRILLSAMICCVALCQSDPDDECGLISASSDISSSASESFVSSSVETEGCTRDAVCNMETHPFTCVCKDGFNGDGVNCNPTITCKRPAPVAAFGRWSEVGDPRENGRFYPGDRLIYTCDIGYAIKRNKGEKFRECGVDGLWDLKKPPACVVAKCDAPDGIIINGNSTVIPGQKYPTGSIVEYSCFPGYRIKGSSWQSCISRDSLSGRWSNPPPTCEEIQCHDVGYPENSNRIGNPPYFIGDVVRFRCMSGYTLIGSDSRTCQANGKWSGYITICENGAGDCRNPGIPINGRKQGQDYNRGDVVVFYCDTGFSLIGSRNRTCLATGEWSGTKPTCRGGGDYDDPASVANSFGKTLDKFVEDTKVPESNGDPRGRTIDLSYGGRLEIYLAIDGSASIGQENFLRAVAFAKALVEKTGVSGRTKGPRYGALTYTDRVEVHFDVTIHEDKQRVLDELDRIEYPTVGGTATASALIEIHEKMIPLSNAVWEWEDHAHGAQPPKRVVILMTDGASNTGGSPIDVANKLKRDYKVEIYVIGINVAERNDELFGIASTELPDEHIFILQDYHALEWLANELVGQQIDYSLCGIAGRTENNGAEGRISGGTNANEGAWPWQVAIWELVPNILEPKGFSHGGFFCGGSIISSEWILTAAHCFYNNKELENVNKDEWHTKVVVGIGTWTNDCQQRMHHCPIFIGYTDRGDDEVHTREITIKKIITHPEYSRLDYDIALMQLNNSVDFGNYIRPVCLPNKTKVSDIPVTGDTMVTTGWGETRNRSIEQDQTRKTDHLQQAYSSVIKWNKCEEDIEKTQIRFNKAKRPLTKNMFCVGNGYPSACKGDSGGPVVKKIPATNDEDEHWVQFGIVSFGYGCGVVGQRDVTTNVTKLIDWIQETSNLTIA